MQETGHGELSALPKSKQRFSVKPRTAANGKMAGGACEAARRTVGGAFCARRRPFPQERWGGVSRKPHRRSGATASPFRRNGITVPAQRHRRSGATASAFQGI